jgi:hypothetical protein
MTTTALDEIAAVIRERVPAEINAWGETNALPPLSWEQVKTPDTGWRGVIPDAHTHPGIGSSIGDLRAIDRWGKTLGLGNDGETGLWSGALGNWFMEVHSPWVDDPASPHLANDVLVSPRSDELERSIDAAVSESINGWGRRHGLPVMNWVISSQDYVDLDCFPVGDISSTRAADDALRWIQILGGADEPQDDPYASWFYLLGSWHVGLYYIRDLEALRRHEPDHHYFTSGVFGGFEPRANPPIQDSGD